MVATIITCVIIFYILPAYKTYKVIQKAYYHPKGRWYLEKVENADIYAVFTPIVNIYFSFMRWKDKKHINDTFFKPKNHLNVKKK